MPHRIPRVQARLDDIEATAILLTSSPDIRWACGFTGSNGVLLVGPDEAHFLTDGRYREQAREEVGESAVVHIVQGGLLSYIGAEDLLAPYGQVAYQADNLTVARRDVLVEQTDRVDWTPETQFLTHQRGVKQDVEVDAIRSAQRLTEQVYDHLVEWVRPGQTEREVAAEIVHQHLKRGADSMSFDPIVASGPNAACPHARPTDRTLRDGDLVVIDMGGFRAGYASDMTRTIAVGTPPDAARRGYELVREAQERALDVAEAGMTGEDLDKVARSVIEESGYGDAFVHGLGHGIGLEVHEWPRVSYTNPDALPEGACVTIEPGVYLPDDGYGVRIEDIVVLREGGSEKLTRAPKEWTAV
jgi:Xaa-Pro aminopeptidase